MDLNINLEEIPDREDHQEYTQLAEGDYIVACVETDYLPNKAGTGKYLKCKFQILEGNSKGRFIWENLNLENPSEKAVTIARQKLKELSHAVGVHGTLNNSAQLHDEPLIIKLGLNKAKDNVEIKKFVSATTTPAPKTTVKAPVVKTETVQKKPWEN